MQNLNRRLRDIFGPSQDHAWCDTTRLANPWSILLGRAHRPPKSGGDGCDLHSAERDTASPSTDLRTTVAKEHHNERRGR
jgi:hypothetical protein